MTDTAFIFHGSCGNPGKHWYPWLKEELEERELQVFAPQFPIDGAEQNMENWLETLEPLKDQLPGSILVGHSLGAPFILDILNFWDHDVKAAFLVSGFEGHVEVEEEPYINDFSDRDFNWEKIRSQCGSFRVIHSDNDPYLPLHIAQRLADKLGVELTLVEGAEHFQKKLGYGKFDLLLEMIDEEL